MATAELAALHNTALAAMNASQSTIDNLHVAMLRAREAHAAAVKAEEQIRLALRASAAADRAAMAK